MGTKCSKFQKYGQHSANQPLHFLLQNMFKYFKNFIGCCCHYWDKEFAGFGKKTRKVIERIWYQYTTYNFKNIITGDWGDGLVVKRTYSSYRGPVLTSQNSFLCISQAPVAPGLWDSEELDLWTLAPMCSPTQKHILHILKCKLKYKIECE